MLGAATEKAGLSLVLGRLLTSDVLACLIDRIWFTEFKKCELICNIYAWIS